MAKHLEKFSKPFQDSRIPFVLTEVITDGDGTMVDLVCRFANPPAAALLGAAPQTLKGCRFTRLYPPQRLAELAAMQAVAFSGSGASLTFQSATGTTLQVTCYQVMYGVVACVLEARDAPASETPALPPDAFPCAACVLELSRRGLRCLSFNQHLCRLTGWSQRELYDRFSQDFSALIHSGDWPALLQSLLDAPTGGGPVCQELRLTCRDGQSVWVSFRAHHTAAGTFCALLPELQPSREHQEQLALRQSQLDSARAQLSALLHTLPGAFLLARCLPDASPEIMAVSDRLAQLLEYPAQELIRQLNLDPFFCIPAQQREELEASLVRGRVMGLPFRQLCPVRTGTGRLLQLVLEGTWRSDGQDGAELYLTCGDRTEEQQTQSELRLRTQLCDLLLDRSQIISLDYLPGEDVAHVETYDGGGHRSTRRIEAYLSYLEDAPVIHPDDRRRLISALRRACAHPGTGALEYRGNYDGRGWRWFRVSLVSLFDARGDVYGLLGKAEDISDRKAAALRFQTLSDRYKAVPPGTLVFIRLDLTAGRILDAQGENDHLLGVVFANSAEASLRHLRRIIPDRTQRAEFARRFTPTALMESFAHGQSHYDLEHRLRVEASELWVHTTLEMAENPDSRHVELFCAVADVDSRCRESALLTALARRDYAALVTVDVADGSCRVYGPGGLFPAGASFDAVAARQLRNLPPTPQRTALRRALRVETILSRLRESPVYRLDCPPREAGGPPGRVCCSFLDEERKTLLITLEYP